MIGLSYWAIFKPRIGLGVGAMNLSKRSYVVFLFTGIHPAFSINLDNLLKS